MFDSVQEKLSSLFARGDKDDNFKISEKQKLIIKFLVVTIVAVGLGLAMLIQEKKQRNPEKLAQEEEQEIVKVDLPDKGLNPELHWRNYYDDQRAKDKREMEERFKEMAEMQAQVLAKANNVIEQELKATKEKLAMAQRELSSASLDLKRVAREEEERLQQSPQHQESTLSAQSFNQEIEFDRPKPAAKYVPEGTYFTGNLLGGIVVSTALNTPDENATPVSIKLKDRGNLSKLNKTDISKCRIMGSAYGDLASERAIVRLEKMVCEENGMYITSKITGQVHGPDGFNGIKGTIIATSSKHITNAMIGGLISGLSSSVKGQEGFNLSSGGLVSTQSKSAKEMLGQGVMQGVSNAGEKVAEYSLRLAEAMSPILTITSGARVNAQITSGFYIGEVGTHRKIQDARQQEGGRSR